MKSGNDGRRKSIVSKVIAFLAIAFVVAGCVSILPAVVNYFMQPWYAAKMFLFNALANVFHFTPMGDMVNMSTSNIDKWAYGIIQVFQVMSVLVDELGLTKSESTKKWLHWIRGVSYCIEIPVNGLYSYWYFSQGDGRDPNFITMWCKVIVFTGVATFIFEGLVLFFCRGIKGLYGVFKDNHENGSKGKTVDVSSSSGGGHPGAGAGRGNPGAGAGRGHTHFG